MDPKNSANQSSSPFVSQSFDAPPTAPMTPMTPMTPEASSATLVEPMPATPSPMSMPEPTPSVEPSQPTVSMEGNMPPADLLANANTESSSQPTSPFPQSASPVPPPPVIAPSRKFPKKLLAIIVFLLVLVLGVVGVFAAISGGVKLPGGKTTITWWSLWEDDSIITPLITEYQTKNPGVEIKYVKQSKEDYRERLTNALAKGDGPDIFRFHNTWVPMFSSRLSTMPSSVMSAQEFTQTFYPVVLSDLAAGSGFVGIPLMYDGLGLYINEDIFTTYGQTTPVTWYDVRDLAQQMTVKDEAGVIKQAGVSLGTTANVDNWQEILALMMIQNGVDLKNPTGENAIQALKFYTAFSKQYGVWNDTLPTSTIAFASGKVAMYIGPSWRAHEIRQQNPTLKFRVVPVPQLPKATAEDPDIAYATYWVEGVNSQSKVSTEAWKFLKFLSEKESLTKMYKNATAVRAFGALYPRRDMQELIASDPLVNGVIATATNAKSWYLASRTFDGQSGINSQLSKYFEDGVNAMNGSSASDGKSVLETVSAGVQSVLVQFRLIAPPPAVKK